MNKQRAWYESNPKITVKDHVELFLHAEVSSAVWKCMLACKRTDMRAVHVTPRADCSECVLCSSAVLVDGLCSDIMIL